MEKIWPPIKNFSSKFTVSFPLALIFFGGVQTVSKAQELSAGSNAMEPTKTAVSGENFAIFGAGGVDFRSGLAFGGGQFAMPLGGSTGLQIDGQFSSFNSRFGSQLNGHAFQRDPDRYLIGAYASWSHADISEINRDIGRAAIEGELYLDDFTLSGIAGYEFGGAAVRFFNQSRASFYINDNVKILIGYLYENDQHFGSLGTEYQLSTTTNASLFAEAQFGERGDNSAWAGMKLVFGDQSNKSIAARDREDFAPRWKHASATRDQHTATPPVPTPSIEPTPLPSPSVAPTPSIEPTPSPSPSVDPTPSPTPSTTPEPTPTVEQTPPP